MSALDPALQMSHQCWVAGEDTLPWPSGKALPKSSHYAIDLLLCLNCPILVHIQCLASAKLHFNLLPVGSFLQPVEVPLYGSLPVHQMLLLFLNSLKPCWGCNLSHFMGNSWRWWAVLAPVPAPWCTNNVWPPAGNCPDDHNLFSLRLDNSFLLTLLSICHVCD